MISRWATTTFASLEHPHYRILWAGTALGTLAFMMSSIVQSVVAFDITGKNGAVGLVALGMGAATIIVSPFGGVIADRMSKRKLLLIGQSAIGVNFLVIGVLIVTGHITLVALVASTFVMGTVFSFIAPARQAWIGDLLPGEALANGVALQQMAMAGTRIVGPFVAGLLISIAIIGSGGTYLFMGALFIVVVGTLAQLPPTKSRPKEGSPTIMADMLLGVRHISDRPPLRLLTFSFIAMIVAGFSYQVILPGFLENELGRNPDQIGWMLGIGAIGGLAVTLGVAGYAGSRYAWQLMLITGVLLALSLFLLALAPNFALALCAMLLVGGGSSGFQLLNNALVMQETDPVYFGRVMSFTMLAWGANGLAGLPFGLLADALGERQTFFVMGLLVLAVASITAAFHVLLKRRATPTELKPISVIGGK